MIDVSALKARVDLPAVVGHYVPLVKRGREFVGKCVSHSPDANPSMYVYQRSGAWRIKCFACGFNADAIEFIQLVEGCDFKAACDKLGGTEEWSPTIANVPQVERPNRVTGKPPMGEPMPDMAIRSLGRPSKVWCYRDTDGLPLGYVARYEVEGGKEVRCWSWGARGDEAAGWGCGHWNRPRPLYGLDRLTARPDAPVLVVEGEKAADAAAALLPAYVAVTWPGGAESWHRADWQVLERREVLLWPDADPPGVEAMQRLADLLSDPSGLGCAVSILDVAGQPEAWDAADAQADGLTGAALIAWARPRKKAWTAPPPAAASAPADSPPEADTDSHAEVERLLKAQEPPQDDGSNPPAADIGDPPAALASLPEPERPRRRRPALSVVGSLNGSGGGASAAEELNDTPLPQALSDDALGDYFAAQHGETLKYVPEWSSTDHPAWLLWDGNGWQRDVLERHFGEAMLVTRRAAQWPDAASLSPRERRGLNSTARGRSLLSVARCDARVALRADVWDADPYLLGIPGGSIDLRDGSLREAVKSDYITRHTSVAPARGETPLFDAVLGRACGGDVGMLDYLWRWLGYCLTGDTREECFLFLHGPGGSGKSTLTSVLLDVLDDYAVTAKMETFAETKQTKHAEELARLDGARLVVTSETDEGQRWNESRIKWLTGRNKITANFMRSNSFEFKPQFKLLIEGNHRPGLKSVGEEMRRRIHLVEYAGSIPEGERDRDLKNKLKREYPAILHRMVESCVDWQAHGLARPASVDKFVTEYLETEDTLGAWLEECCDLKAGAPLSATSAFRSFREWASAHNEYCPSQKRFSLKLQDRGFEKRKTAAGMQFIGLELRLPALTPPPSDPDWLAARRSGTSS